MAVQRDAFLYRSYLGQKKFGLVEEEIGGGADERIKPIRTLAKYLKVINKLRGYLSGTMYITTIETPMCTNTLLILVHVIKYK